jgi:hypothetical protein
MWRRQAPPFVGRAGDVGDDEGSRLATARLARDIMLLCFSQERRYAPYNKWSGTAFAMLASALAVAPALADALAAAD